MRILILEYLTGGGLLSQPAPGSLLAEGAVMVEALVRDLRAIPDIRLSVFRDHRAERFLPLDDPRVEEIRVCSEAQFRREWRERLHRCDAVWAIAPESEGLLERLARQAEASGAAWLGCPAHGIRLAGDKLATADRLAAHGIATVPTRLAASVAGAVAYPAVVKPIDGVGCAGSRILRNGADWNRWRLLAAPRRHVLQPLVSGDALSLSVLFRHGYAYLLSCNRQHVRLIDDRFALAACEVNVLPELRAEFADLADRIAAAMPELWGYGGVDLIRNERGCLVLEINPRLTTSYAGLNPALGINPARAVLELRARGNLPDAHPVGTGSVRVNVEGRHDD